MPSRKGQRKRTEAYNRVHADVQALGSQLQTNA
jgi:hypothetical protein